MIDPNEPGIPGKKLVPLIFLLFVVITAVCGFGTFFLGKHFAPKPAAAAPPR